jgi:hypothetical protein
MPSELPRSKEALVFSWGANASALLLFPPGGETDWRIRSIGPQDSAASKRGPNAYANRPRKRIFAAIVEPTPFEIVVERNRDALHGVS